MAKHDTSPGPEAGIEAFMRMAKHQPAPPPNAFSLRDVIRRARQDHPHLAHKSDEALKNWYGRQLRQEMAAGKLFSARIGRDIKYWYAEPERAKAKAKA